jgi:hypothetical protein
MKVPAITILIWFGIAATASAQGTTGKASQGAPSQAQLSEIRSVLNELQARTEKLHELMEQYRSMIGERPQSQEQHAKWSTALDRLMHRIDQARAAVTESSQRLDQLAKGSLPTSLGKDVANAHNDAEAQRTAAEQALLKNKPATGRTSKPAKQTAAKEKAPPPSSDGLDDL